MKHPQNSQSEQILDAAYLCLAKEGYAQVSLRQIAREAGVAVSQLSYYYENKEGLLLAIVARAAQKYNTLLQAHLPEGKTPQEKGKHCIKLFQEILEQEPELFRVLYDLAGLALRSDIFNEKVRELFADIINHIAEEIFEPTSLPDIMQEYCPYTLSRLLLGSLFGISIQSLLQPEQGEIIQSLSVLEILFDKH